MSLPVPGVYMYIAHYTASVCSHFKIICKLLDSIGLLVYIISVYIMYVYTCIHDIVVDAA